jgi:hypothetical protein
LLFGEGGERMVNARSSKRRRKPIGEWPLWELWFGATSIPVGAIALVVFPLVSGDFYGAWDRWLMGTVLAFMVACLTVPALLRFSIPAWRELWRRWRGHPSAAPGTSPE